MIILSIYPGHNAAIAIIKDGQLLLNLELERFSRIKHDYGYNESFLRFALNTVGLEIADIDFLTTNAWMEIVGRHNRGNVELPFYTPYTMQELAIPFKAQLLGRKIPAIAVNHHLAHVACTFYTSPFDQASILSHDGGGDGVNTGLAFGRGKDLEEIARENQYDLCCVWSGLSFNNYRMPCLHEWDPGSGAGKIMALAAYGKHDAQIRAQLLKDMEKGLKLPHYTDPDSIAYNDNQNLSDSNSPTAQNLAYALQDITEKQMQALARQLYKGSPNLCLAGGIALNCVANSVVMDKVEEFKNLHVPPCPNDTGLALGMVLWAWHHYFGNERTPAHFVPYTGAKYGEKDIAEALDWAREQGLDLKEEELSLDRLSDILAQGNVVCCYRGKSECGPRALGHRSIIARPDIPGLRDFLNFKVKMREWYRPFAPIIRKKDAGIIFSRHVDNSPYMSTAAIIRPEWREKLAAVCHVDNSTRPQLLEPQHEPWLYQLLDLMEQKTGIPVIVNTSFNRSEPIVETPKQAVQTFASFPLSYLVLENRILRK